MLSSGHVSTSHHLFKYLQEKDTCLGVPYPNLPFHSLSFLLSPLTHLVLSIPITSLLHLWFLFFCLWLWLCLSVYFRNPPSYCISPLTLSPSLSQLSRFLLGVYFFLRLPFLSSHSCHNTEMPPTLSTSVCIGLLKRASLFTCKFLL